MSAYADGLTPSWEVEAGTGDLLLEQADAGTEWGASQAWQSEAGWDSEVVSGTLQWTPAEWSIASSEDDLPNGEAIPVAAILPAIAQLAPVLLQAAPAIVGAVNAAMPALQGLLQAFTQGGAPAAVTRGREMASETAVLESTLAAIQGLLDEAGAEGAYANALVEPPESRFAHLEGGEFLPALAGIVAALAPVVGQVISAVTSNRPARPVPVTQRPVAPSRPVAAPIPASPLPAGTPGGAAAQALALLPQLMPLLTQLTTQLAAPPAGNPGPIPPTGNPGAGMPLST